MSGIPCPLCGATGAVERYSFPDNPWLPGTVVRCECCGLRYKRPAGGPGAVVELYERPELGEHDYWEGEAAAADDFERILTALRAVVPGGGRVLDIGCGPGTFAGLARAAGYEVWGIEPNGVLADQAAQSGVEVVRGRAQDVDLPTDSFDAVTLLDVVEHLLDPGEVLRVARTALAPGGHLVVFTPNHGGLIARLATCLHRMSGGRVSGPVREIFDGPHVAFYDTATLQALLRRHGFEPVSVAGVAYRPARSRQAGRATGLALRAIELASPVGGGPFRLLVTARTITTPSPDTATGPAG